MSRPELEPLRDHFPLRLGHVDIYLVDGPADARDPQPDEIWAPIQLVEFDFDGSVRNVLEQSVRLAPHPNLLADAERVAHCIAAHAEV